MPVLAPRHLRSTLPAMRTVSPMKFIERYLANTSQTQPSSPAQFVIRWVAQAPRCEP